MSDYETIQSRRNMIVGVFVVLGICALVWLIFKFGDLPTAVTKLSSFEIFVQFPTAPGVQRDTPVRFCGYQIGRVTKVMAPEIRKDKSNGLEYYQTVVILSIDDRYVNIPSNIEVKLMTRGLGSSYLELKQHPGMPAEPLDPNRPETVFLVNGTWLQGSTGMTSEFFPEESQKKLDELINGIVSFVGNANEIVGDIDNKNNIHKILANLTDASEEAKETMQQARRTVEEFRGFAAAGTSTLKNADVKVEQLVASLIDTSEEVGRATTQLRLILEKVNNGQGSASRIVNDGRLYERLLESTEQLDILLQDARSLIVEYRAKGIKLKL